MRPQILPSMRMSRLMADREAEVPVFGLCSVVEVLLSDPGWGTEGGDRDRHWPKTAGTECSTLP